MTIYCLYLDHYLEALYTSASDAEQALRYWRAHHRTGERFRIVERTTSTWGEDD